MRSWLLVLFGIIVSGLIISALIYSQKLSIRPPESVSIPLPVSHSPNPAPSQEPTSSISPAPSASPAEITPQVEANPSAAPSMNPTADLTADSNGLSKATVIIQTTEGVIKFKFYSNDAPKTVKRVAELIQKGFYNGLTFHRVIQKFIVQGGDPLGNGNGGSGQKLEPEFNQRHHIEGTVAMARGADPNSADSQFYITLDKQPHLDGKFTIFGQVIEGMDVAKKLKPGDKMMSVIIQ